MSQDLNSFIHSFFSSQVLKTQAYSIPSIQGDVIKLDAMEFPFNISLEFKEELQQAIQKVQINLYPSITNLELKNLFLQEFNLSSDSDVLFGNGSDELIQLLILCCVHKKHKVMALTPSFVMYQIICQNLNLPFCDFCLNEDFSLDEQGFLQQVKQEQPKLIFLASPNNPTGKNLSIKFIKELAQVSQALIVLDETYFYFSNQNLLPLVEQFSNVIVMRTISKIGFASIRFGYMFGNTQVIEQLNKLRMPYNINSLTAQVVQLYFKHKKQYQEKINWLINERERLHEELNQLENFNTQLTQTNFVLLDCVHYGADTVFNYLLENKILVKNLSKAHFLLSNYLRINVGTQEQNDLLIQLLKKL